MTRIAQILKIANPSKRDQGRRAQHGVIQAGSKVADIIRTTLGPKAMVKMLLDPMGGIVLTSDGNAILREIDIQHPAARTIIELSRAQDEEVGDGTTSVVLIAGELLSLAEPLLERQLHPTQIVYGFIKALDYSLSVMEEISILLDSTETQKLEETINTCLGTKFSSRYGKVLPRLALEAAKIVTVDISSEKKSIEIKKYAKIEKIPGGEPEDSRVVKGIMLNKDVTHPKMRRKIVNPRVVLLDSPLEYKKGESQTNVEITEEDHWRQLLQQEEDEVKQMCDYIIKIGCDIVVTEKGVSDLAQHFLVKAGISVLRRVKKSDNNRLARVTSATIVSRPSELRPEDVGYDCGLFEVTKIGDEYYSFFTECKDPKACSVVLRGGSKDVLNETERNLHDALNVARSLLLEPRILPGGGATELEISARLSQKASTIEDVSQLSYKTVALALEIIPMTLIQNCGVNVVRTITELRSRHAVPGSSSIGIDGKTGEIIDVIEHKIWDTYATKHQVIKAAIETAAMLLRIDDILSATTSKSKNSGTGVEDDTQQKPVDGVEGYED